MLHFACSTEFFPLTLTLSLREREQQASGWRLADGCWPNSGSGVVARQWSILPLPKGEGRGAGGKACSLSHGPISTDGSGRIVVRRLRIQPFWRRPV